MNEIEVQRKEQKVKSEKVGDFTNSSFHKYWIYGLTNIGLRSVFAAKIDRCFAACKNQVMDITQIGHNYPAGARISTIITFSSLPVAFAAKTSDLSV
jgi:hypothetical protein